VAADAATSVTQPSVILSAVKRLRTNVSPALLSAAVSPTVSSTTGQLEITATWSNSSFAAALANAVAQAVVTNSNGSTRARFTALAAQIRQRMATLQSAANGKPSAKTTGAGEELLFYDQELARIDTVLPSDQSAQIASLALPPGAPSSPDKTRSIVLGIVLGLLLGVLCAFVRDALDRRLRSARDVESSFHLPVLGYVRDRAMGRVAFMSNGSGRSDQHLDIEAFRIVRRNLEFLTNDSAPRSIIVTSGLPEEGKTTVASSLAFAMAAAGKRTLLVDCDLRRSSLSSRLELNPSPGLSDFLAGTATPEEVLQTVAFGDQGGGNGAKHENDDDGTEHNLLRLACVVAGSPTPRPTEALGSVRFTRFIEEVSQVYDIVILDSSPLLPVADTLEMLPHVDAVILCAREFQTTHAEAAAAKAALARLPERPTGLVVTGVKPGREDYSSYSYYSYA
jgi:polysaccharide biosynthesis transport protein